MNLSNDELMRMIQRISGLYRRGLPEAGAAATSVGVSPCMGSGRVLSLLVRGGDGISQTAMAEQLNIRPQSLSESLSKMEERGYIRRCPNPQDKRGTLVYLTDEGREQERMLAERRHRAADSLLSVLDEQQKQVLASLLDKILSGQA